MLAILIVGFALVLLLFLLNIGPYIKRRRILAWHSALNLHQHQHYFNTIFQHVDGFALSKQARALFDAPEYCYGEIEFISFIALLSLCKITKDTVFYDLGSGVGKAVIALALVFDVKQCVGIELFDELHQAALMSQERLEQMSEYTEKASRIVFLQGNLHEASLQDAHIIFVNASAFLGPLWDQISQHCEQIAPGTIVITTSKPLRSDVFIIQKQTRVEMSWGVVNAYIQVKV